VAKGTRKALQTNRKQNGPPTKGTDGGDRSQPPTSMPRPPQIDPKTTIKPCNMRKRNNKEEVRVNDGNNKKEKEETTRNVPYGENGRHCPSKPRNP
jgi:hypothetical protein